MSPHVETCNIIKPILEFPEKRLAPGVEGCEGWSYFIREMVDAKVNATSFCKLRRYYTWHSN